MIPRGLLTVRDATSLFYNRNRLVQALRYALPFWLHRVFGLASFRELSGPCYPLRVRLNLFIRIALIEVIVLEIAWFRCGCFPMPSFRF